MTRFSIWPGDTERLRREIIRAVRYDVPDVLRALATAGWSPPDWAAEVIRRCEEIPDDDHEAAKAAMAALLAGMKITEADYERPWFKEGLECALGIFEGLREAAEWLPGEMPTQVGDEADARMRRAVTSLCWAISAAVEFHALAHKATLNRLYREEMELAGVFDAPLSAHHGSAIPWWVPRFMRASRPYVKRVLQQFVGASIGPPATVDRAARVLAAHGENRVAADLLRPYVEKRLKSHSAA